MVNILGDLWDIIVKLENPSISHIYSISGQLMSRKVRSSLIPNVTCEKISEWSPHE